MPSLRMTEWAPPASLMALQPRLVEATRQPSVVAMGTYSTRPSSVKGPTTPTHKEKEHAGLRRWLGKWVWVWGGWAYRRALACIR